MKPTYWAHEEREAFIVFVRLLGWCLSVLSRSMITAYPQRSALRLLFEPVLSLEVYCYLLGKLLKLTAHVLACFFVSAASSRASEKTPLPDLLFFTWPVGHLPRS